MKILLIGLLAFGSASYAAESTYEENIFVSTVTDYSDIPFMSGCIKARRRAKADAKAKCLSAGYYSCKKLATLKMNSKGRKLYSYWSSESGGYCRYKAIYRGHY